MGTDMIEYIAEKPPGYYSETRWALIQLVENGPHKVLDVGCGEGKTGAALKACGRAQEVIGIEKNPTVAAVAKNELDQVICCDVEMTGLPVPKGHFDYIVLGDILEHLVDPWAVVVRLARCLKQRGHVVASVPNVRYWRVVLPLVLTGEWKYRSQGVLDNTHLRFFTKKGIQRLFHGSGLVVQRMVPAFRLLPKSKTCRADRLTLGLFEGFLTMRYIIDASRR